MPEIAAYIKELLEEDMFGTEYHERIQDRVATLNLSQLTKMQAHLEDVAATATFSYWKEANTKVENNFGGFLQMRQDEKDRNDQDQYDLEKKIEQRAMRKAGLKAEEDKVRGFIERHCEATARDQIVVEEKERRVQERAMLRRAVHVNERRRHRIYVAAVVIALAGVAAAVLTFPSNIPLLVAVIAGTAFFAGFLAVFGFVITRGAPQVISTYQIEHMVAARAAELRVQAEEELHRKEGEFKSRQVVDREERRERKKQLRERRELERQIVELDQLERGERGEGSTDTSVVTPFQTPLRHRAAPTRHGPSSMGWSGATWATGGGSVATHLATMGDDGRAVMGDDEDEDDEDYDSDEGTDSEYDVDLLQGGESTLLSMRGIGVGGVNSPGLSTGMVGGWGGLESPLAGGGGSVGGFGSGSKSGFGGVGLGSSWSAIEAGLVEGVEDEELGGLEDYEYDREVGDEGGSEGEGSEEEEVRRGGG